MKLESVDYHMIQTSIGHAVLFVTRFKEKSTIHEAYLIETQLNQAPDMTKEPMSPILLRMAYMAMEEEQRSSVDYKHRANQCIKDITQRIGFDRTRVS